MDITCKHCDRYLFKAAGTVIIEELPCPNSKCKAKLNFKIVSNDINKDIRHSFQHQEQPPKVQQKETT